MKRFASLDRDFGSASLKTTSSCHGSVWYSGSILREMYSDSRSVVDLPADAIWTAGLDFSRHPMGVHFLRDELQFEALTT
jgi:hypothetical protein